MTAVGLTLIFSLLIGPTTFVQGGPAFVRQARAIETDNLGIPNPAGLTFSPASDAFYVVQASTPSQPPTAFSDINVITPVEDLIGSLPIPAAITDPVNMALDSRAGRLLILQPSARRWIEIPVGSDGALDPAALAWHDARHFGLQNPQGMTVDPVSGRLFVLDVAGPRIVRIEPHPEGDFDRAVITPVDLQPTGLGDPRGLAFDPSNGHLHLLSLAEQRLYELTDTGQVVATRDVSGFKLRGPKAMVFAPSGDLTDDPSQMSLYLADSGLVDQQIEGSGSLESRSGAGEAEVKPQTPGRIIELSFGQPVMPEASTYEASLVQTIDTSQFSPPSPDPAGIAYVNSSNSLLVGDSEVDEMSIFTGENLFQVTLSGALFDTLTTIPFSDEPTGVAYNPGNGYLFFSDDEADKVFEIDPGADELYGTADDTITSFSTRLFRSSDPEGIAFASGPGVLFIADGLNAEIYRVTSGDNQVFDGPPPAGDDEVTNFDTAGLGVLDPEGIASNPDNGHLYIVGEPSDWVAELTSEGSLVQMIDISAANSTVPAGLAYGPRGSDPAVMDLYITDRGVDNDSDPNENDGKVYEMSLPSGTPGNQPPTATISAPADGATFAEGDSILFSGSASDPEDGDVTASLVWVSSLDGQIGTGAFFSRSNLSVGEHVITATATDSGGLTGSDGVTLSINARPTATPTPTNTPTPTPTNTPTSTPTNTPTPTPSDTPTPTPTATPELGTVRGRIRLERRVNYPNANAGARVQLAGQSQVTGNDGAYSFSTVPAGTHQISVTHPSYLPTWRNVDVTAGATSMLPDVTMLGGDCSATQGVIDETDSAVMGQAWGTIPGDPDWEVRADVRDDGVINVLDFTAVQFNWLALAPGPWTGSAAAVQAAPEEPPVLSLAPQGAAQTTVVVSPSVITTTIGAPATVEIWVQDVEGLYAGGFEIDFDAGVVSAQDANPYADGVQIEAGSWLERQLEAVNGVDNATGYIEYSVTQTRPVTGKDGSGILARITFVGKTEGSSVLQCSRLKLVDDELITVSATAQDGQVVVAGGARIYLPLVLRGS